MKALRLCVLLVSIFFMPPRSHAQTGSDTPAQRALILADSLVSAFQHQNWESYIELSYPGMIGYYGGHQRFSEYIRILRRSTGNGPIAFTATLELAQIEDSLGEWQCVIRKSNQAVIDGRKATIVTYLVGQSPDNGSHWTYFDLAFHSPENIAEIMPGAFAKLKVPTREIIFATKDLAAGAP